MLETFSEKSTCLILKFTYYSKRSKGLKGLINRFYKKEKKENVRNILREVYLSNSKVYLPFQEIRRSKEFKKPFLQKRKKKRMLETFSEKPTCPNPKSTYHFSPF